MISLSRINPGRRLVGRLFLWFWLTLLVSVFLAAWLASTFDEELELGSISAREQGHLNHLATRIAALESEDLPLQQILERRNRGSRYTVFAVNLGSEEVVRTPGPPIHRRENKLLRRMVSQQVPITFTRGRIKLIGPQRISYQGSEYALFLGRRTGPPEPMESLYLLIPVAILITMLLSFLFARTLVRPILQLQQSSQALAGGNWQARAELAARRQDELGQLARDFNSMAEQLERMWKGQKRLLADISHELRSPLARLQMALGLAHQQQVDPQILQRIEREAERMESLIEQLLQLGRAESGTAQMQLTTIPDLFNDLVEDAEFEASSLNKLFICNSLPESKVMVNPELICSAVENVVRNALRYCHTAVAVNINATAEQWRITVKDDGPGLTLEESEAIFTPFYRASLARERHSGGVGLGLAIAKAAVELHHGRIHALPVETGGLVVTITLPNDGRTKWNGN